jgi:photosystem II stability/assembly factor-like uncharacterized protein
MISPGARAQPRINKQMMDSHMDQASLLANGFGARALNASAISIEPSDGRRHVVAAFAFTLALLWASSASCGVNRFTPVAPTGGGVERVVINTRDPSIVYASTWEGFNRSTDGGKTWQLVSDAMTNEMQDLAINPAKPDIVMGVGQDNVWVSTDAGASIDRVAFPGGNVGLQQEVEYSADGTVVYVASGRYVYRSLDDGKTWTKGGLIDLAFGVNAMAVDPANPQRIVIADGTVGHLSVDGGNNWTSFTFPSMAQDLAIAAWTATRVWLAANSGVWYSDDWGVNWVQSSTTGGPLMVRVDRSNQRVIYAGGEQTLERSSDNGASWSSLPSTRTGLILSLDIDTHDPSHLILSGTEGVASSTDGGAHWESHNSGIHAATLVDLQYSASTDRIYARQLAGAPIAIAGATGEVTELNYDALRDQGNGYSVYTLNLALNPGTPDQLWASTLKGVSRSLDSGASWSPFPLNFLMQSITPTSADGHRLLATGTQGLYRSTDGGAHWDLAAPMSSGANLAVLRRSLSNPAVVYGTSWTNGGTEVTLMRTSDGGENWSTIVPPQKLVPGAPVAVDPTNENTLYVGSGSKLYRSNDAGVSWKVINLLDSYDYPGVIGIDPVNPNILYLSGTYITRSVDGGAHWQRISSVNDPFELARELLVDPKRSSTVYAAMDGKSIRSITIQQDLELTVSAPTQPIGRGSAGVYKYQIKDLGPFDATRVHFTVQGPANSTIGASSTSATCSVSGVNATCDIPALLLNQTIDIAVQLTQPTNGSYVVNANVQADQSDLAPSNNSLESTMAVADAPATPPSTGGGKSGGGGGSDSLLLIGLLAGLRSATRYRVRG